MLLCLLTVPVRYGLTLCASDMSDRASKDVKRTLRSSIYAKLTRLGAGYSETVATSSLTRSTVEAGPATLADAAPRRSRPAS